MSLYEKLVCIQAKLKAPKNQYNSFGKYNYRSCEDILEGVKPLLEELKCILVISDEVVEVGGRIYIKATVNIIDVESGEKISNSAYAREAAEKKGMDDSQITGTASSYARKYALGGMFCIDDTKDADTDEYKASTNKAGKAGKSESSVKSYKCHDCGKPFVSFTDKNGKTWSEGQVYHMSETNNTDGVARCSDCMNKAGTRKQKG